MSKQYWLVKQEPTDYGWVDFLAEKKTVWSGVRSFAARKHLSAMKKGDLVLFYHSGKEKQVVGLARVQNGPYPDPSDSTGQWISVDLVPVKTLRRPVALRFLKSDPLLKTLPLVRQSRLSVSPVSKEQFEAILTVAQTAI